MLLAEPTLWDDNERAQRLLKERTDAQAVLARLAAPNTAIEDALELAELAEMEDDDSVAGDITASLASAEGFIEQLEFTRMLGGEQDKCDAILTINAGAGGTDSQDWAEMLLRMYARFCERQGWSVQLLDRQDGEEAGIKGATLGIRGDYAYGMLRSEAGVHRLVRISPFDSNARRQTSFAAVFVFPDIEDDIEIEINDGDLRVDTFRASGAGGQHVNKTDSAIRIVHEPTGIVVQCQAERSQHKNRAKAMKMLKARLYDLEVQNRNAEKDIVEAGKQDNSFGSQIRNYVMHPYQVVKDLRTNEETSNVQGVLDGDLEAFVKSWLIANPS
ncbi:MAG: peptide chain release factor 2 [Myxococcota bacterium]